MAVTRKEYLGDGCYVAFDGYSLLLTTEDGISVTNLVVLEPQVWAALVAYVARLGAHAQAEAEPDVFAALKALYAAIPDCEDDFIMDTAGNHIAKAVGIGAAARDARIAIRAAEERRAS